MGLALWTRAWVLCCGIRSLHMCKGSRKNVKVCLRVFDREDSPQCQSCLCVNVCAVILQCARGKVLLELGRLKAASWISSRRTSQGSQVCSPCPTPHWAFVACPEGPACRTLTQSLVHVSGRANQRCTAVGICVCYSSILPEKAQGVCGYMSACAHLSLTETYACAMA